AGAGQGALLPVAERVPQPGQGLALGVKRGRGPQPLAGRRVAPQRRRRPELARRQLVDRTLAAAAALRALGHGADSSGRRRRHQRPLAAALSSQVSFLLLSEPPAIPLVTRS